MASNASSSPPRFAVVTISYNNLAGLRLTVANILAQGFRDFDWAIVDGGSTDGTAEFLAGIEFPRLHYVSEPDGGIYNAMNKGVAMTRGSYLIFMNAGDGFATPGELGSADRDVATDAPDLLYGDTFESDGGRDLLKRARAHRFYWYSMFSHHQSIYYHRRLFDALRYDESFSLAGDWALTVSAVKRARKIRYVSRPISRFQRGGSSFLASPERRNAEMMRVYREYVGLSGPLLWLISGVKSGVNAVRAAFPGLYDVLRFRRHA